MALNNNAININAGFEVGSKQPIDARQVLTKAQMKTISDNVVPENYFCVCKDDGLLYTYDVNNEVDKETGKYRVTSGLEVIRLTQAEYNQLVEEGKVEEKFYLITDATNPYAIGGVSEASNVIYDNIASDLEAVNVQQAIDEVNEKTKKALATAATAIAAIDGISDDTKLEKVTTIPADPSDGDTVIYIGTTTDSYTKGHVYQYQTNEWVDLSPEEGRDEEARETATGAIALATTANEKAEEADTKATNAIEGLDDKLDKVVELTQAQYDQLVSNNETEDKFYFITDANGETTQEASNTSYDNTTSGLASDNVQDAIDEVNTKIENVSQEAEDITYDNTTSELTATNVQTAIDEVNTKVDNIILEASNVTYDNTNSELVATDTQNAIDEVNTKVDNISQDASGISYDNTTSGLTATNTQSAIDEVNTKVDNIPNAVVPKGTVAFANLPELTNVEVGWMYNINDNFTTTSDFITSGISEKAGSNVYCIEVSGTKKWDVFAATEDIVVDTEFDTTSNNPIANSTVATDIETRLKKVATIPVSPSDGDTVLFIGTTTSNYTNGHIYQYSSTDTKWNDLTPSLEAGSGIDITDNTISVIDRLEEIDELPEASIELFEEKKCYLLRDNQTGYKKGSVYHIGATFEQLYDGLLLIPQTGQNSLNEHADIFNITGSQSSLNVKWTPKPGIIILFKIVSSNEYKKVSYFSENGTDNTTLIVNYEDGTSKFWNTTSNRPYMKVYKNLNWASTSVDVDTTLDTTSNNPIANSAVSTAIDNLNTTKLEKVTTIPVSPSDGDTVLFTGATTSTYTNGHIYQYQTNNWVDVSATGFQKTIQIDLNDLMPEDYNNGIIYQASSTAITGDDVRVRKGHFYTVVDNGAGVLAWDEIVLGATYASGISYDNTNSGLAATNVQSAIDEVNTKVNSIPDAVVPKGTVAFTSLPSLSNVEVGWMYNISDDFTTTSDFVTYGVSEKAGSNVYCIEVDVSGTSTKKWDVFAVSDNVVVDQTYDATSTNPQSGTAVAEAMSQAVTQAVSEVSGHYTISYNTSTGFATLTVV